MNTSRGFTRLTYYSIPLFLPVFFPSLSELHGRNSFIMSNILFMLSIFSQCRLIRKFVSELNSKKYFALTETFACFLSLDNNNHIMYHVLFHVSNLVHLSGAISSVTSQLQCKTDLSYTEVRF